MKYISKLIYFGECKVCGSAFEGSLGYSSQKKRITCSRSCANAHPWLDPEKKKKRMASLKVSQNTQAALARVAAHNKRRWAKPEERRKLSEWNKARWADPNTKKSLSKAIKKAQAKPEYRKALSARKVELWKNEAYRTSHTEAVRKALQSPENRARASAKLRGRWKDPIKRKAMLDGHARMRAKIDATRGRPLSELELAVLDTIISKCTNGIYLADLRTLCRDAGISSRQISKIVKNLIIQRKVIKMRFIPNALRVSGRGIAA